MTRNEIAMLCRCWFETGEGGPPLYDALEEAGWPWDSCTLGFDGTHRALAGVVPPMGNRKWYWTLCPGTYAVRPHGWARSRKGARAAAEAALRSMLLGG